MICVRMSMRGSIEALPTAVRSSARASSRRSATDDGRERSGARSAALVVSTFAGRGPRSCFVFRCFGGVLDVAG